MAAHPPSTTEPSSGPLLDRVRLRPLMAATTGLPAIGIGLVDGPVDDAHPELAGARIVAVGGADGASGALSGASGEACGGAGVGSRGGGCVEDGSRACGHGTFVAGILAGRRGGPSPAISPGCSLLVRPVFAEAVHPGAPPTADPAAVAQAICDCVAAGARIVNLSAATASGPTLRAERPLRDALDHVAARGAIVVAAAGNQALLGSSQITGHPAVLPVVACDRAGRPLALSNTGATIGRRGLTAPGQAVVSLAAGGSVEARSGTSFAAPFVAGALALLWSRAPGADAATVRQALTGGLRRAAVFPPLLDADAAWARLGRR